MSSHPLRPALYLPRIFAHERRSAARALLFLFPGTTEQIQWGLRDLAIQGGREDVCRTPWSRPRMCLSFKASPENYAATSRIGPNIIPPLYLARAQWVALQTRDALAAGGTARFGAAILMTWFSRSFRGKTRDAVSQRPKALARKTRDKNQRKRKPRRSR